MIPKILRINDVMLRVPLCRSAIYKRVKEGTFPAPISLGPRAVGWLDNEIESWTSERIAERDCQAGQ